MNSGSSRKDVGLRVLLLDGLLEDIVRDDVRLVGPVRGPSSARELTDDTTHPVSHNRAGITFLGELVVLARLGIIPKDDELDSLGFDTVFRIMTRDRLESVDSTIGGASSATVLDSQESLGTMDVQVGWVAELLLAYVVLDLEEHVIGDEEVTTVVGLSEHVVFPVNRGFVAACRERTKFDENAKGKDEEIDVPTKTWLTLKSFISNLSSSIWIRAQSCIYPSLPTSILEQ